MTYQTVSFLGLDFHPMSTGTALAHLTKLADRRDIFDYVVTPNVDHIIRLATDPDLRPLYKAAGTCVNDSRILEVLAARSGLSLTASPGADITENLFEHIIHPNEPVTLIGSSTKDVKALKARYGLTQVSQYDAPMGLRYKPDAIEAAAAFMAAHPARFHFLCVGSPQQEMVALAAKQRGDVTGIGLCCGASLDFLSGKTKRAPKWLREARLEWTHRMLSEPKRLGRRYLIDGPRIFGIWHRWRRQEGL